MAAILCTIPKITVNNRTVTATQKVYHCTLLRSSFHHCESVFGSASSKACLRMMIRSLQNLNFLISRPRVGRCPHFATIGSRAWDLISDLSHFLTAGSLLGKRSARVLRVSSRSSWSRRLLESSALWQRARDWCISYILDLDCIFKIEA
jgi:hypothetical protein